MGQLADTIREAVADDRYFVSWHAGEMLEERGITEWQVIAGLDEAQVLKERPRSHPHPSVVFQHGLASGETVQAVWSWLSVTRRAKLVTIFFPE